MEKVKSPLRTSISTYVGMSSDDGRGAATRNTDATPAAAPAGLPPPKKISSAADVSAQSAREGEGGGQQVTLQAIQ